MLTCIPRVGLLLTVLIYLPTQFGPCTADILELSRENSGIVQGEFEVGYKSI